MSVSVSESVSVSVSVFVYVSVSVSVSDCLFPCRAREQLSVRPINLYQNVHIPVSLACTICIQETWNEFKSLQVSCADRFT